MNARYALGFAPGHGLSLVARTKAPEPIQALNSCGTHLIFLGLHCLAMVLGFVGLLVTVPLHLYVISKQASD